MEPVKRNPAGVLKHKPIALRLMPDEKALAEKLARERCISLSRLAREAFLLGLPLVSASAICSSSK